MFIDIDKQELESIQGWFFKDESGETFSCTTPDYNDPPMVDIKSSDYDRELTIFHKDIPRMIKILEAAYNYKEQRV